MRLINADELKKATINNFDNLQAYFPKDFIEEIDNAPTVDMNESFDKLEALVVELTDQICDLIDYMDSKDIFVWLDQDGKIHECRNKEEREADYKAAWLKYITDENRSKEE